MKKRVNTTPRETFTKFISSVERVEPIITHGKYSWKMVRCRLAPKPRCLLADYKRIR